MNKINKLFLLILFFAFMGCGKKNAETENAPKTFLYVANSGNDSISMFSRNTKTGALTPLSPATVQTGHNPRVIVVDSTSTHAFVSNQVDNTISMYNIGSNGVLYYAASAAYSITGHVFSMAISPSNNFVYGGSDGGDVAVFQVNSPSTGSIAYLSHTRAGHSELFSLVIASSGGALYAPDFNNNNIVLLSIQTPSNGLITATSTAASVNGPDCLGINSAATVVYVAATDSINRYSVAANGTLTLYNSYSPMGGYASYSPGVGNIAVSPSGNFGYIVNLYTNYISTFTSAPTYLPTYTTATGIAPTDLKLDKDGHFAYVANFSGNTVTIFSVNTGTGLMTYAGTSSGFSMPASLAIAQK